MPGSKRIQIIVALIVTAGAVIEASLQLIPQCMKHEPPQSKSPAAVDCKDAKTTIDSGSNSVVINCTSAGGDIHVGPK